MKTSIESSVVYIDVIGETPIFRNKAGKIFAMSYDFGQLYDTYLVLYTTNGTAKLLKSN